MRLRNFRHIPLYLVLLLGSLLSFGTASSAPQELDISFNHDLLFLDVSKGNLMRWPAGEVEPEVLAGPNEDSLLQTAGKIVALSASDSGQQFALTVALDEGGYELVWLLPSSLEMLVVETFSLQPEVKASPNGQWVAYRGEEATEVVAVRMDAPEEKFLIGTCEEVETGLRTITCGSFDWSPNSLQLVWSDGRGMWIAQPPAFEKKVLSNPVLQRTEEGDKIVRYSISSWSPTSRYLVLSRAARFDEGTQYVLFDVRSGRLVELPNTYVYGGHHPLHITWLDLSRLSIISGYFASEEPVANIWRIDPGSMELLVHESHFNVGLKCTVITNTGLINQNRISYLVIHVPLWDLEGCEREVDYGLYFSTSPGSYKTLAIELPDHYFNYSDYSKSVWSPDFQDAVLYIEGWQNEDVLHLDLVNLDQGTVEDLTPIIGNAEDVCCFTWVE